MSIKIQATHFCSFNALESAEYGCFWAGSGSSPDHGARRGAYVRFWPIVLKNSAAAAARRVSSTGKVAIRHVPKLTILRGATAWNSVGQDVTLSASSS